MALKANIEFRGLTVPEAYIRVLGIVGGDTVNGWTSQVGVYSSKEARDTGKEPLETYQFHSPHLMEVIADPSEGDQPYAGSVKTTFTPEPFARTYQILKTSRYPQAVDV